MMFKKLIMLGDSNTQFGWGESGWLAHVADMFQRKCDIVQRGFSGYNTDHIKVMLPQLLDEFKQKDEQSSSSSSNSSSGNTTSNICGLVLLMGTNDSTRAEKNECQHVPLERYNDNLRFILDECVEKHGIERETIIVITPGRIDDAKWEAQCQANYQAESTHFDELATKYARACLEVAQEKRVACLDLNRAMAKQTTEDEVDGELLHDGLHFSQKGGKKLFDALKPLLEKHVATGLRLLYPEFSDLRPGQTKIEP